ncbi:rust resistance kinase Lr10-like [Macadamia integrifolia]|uniref:rust resistance kinase Lr10-like n=1 Tax=Macadamia integrifolia TaxID=60698 RepID=UPI001C4EF027|nr:rust resistance kinase Lr10-like [Macadamia integrifolia]
MVSLQKAHVLQILILVLLTPFLVPSRAQQPTNSPMTTDPSFYYNLCAPSRCNNLTLTYPFTLPSPCYQSTYFIPSCPNNETFFLTSSENKNILRVFTNNFTSDGISFSFLTAYNNLFSCGPISSPNFYYSASPLTLPLDYATGTHLNCTTTIPAGALPGLQSAACIGCPGQDPTNVCYYAVGLVTYPNCERFYIFPKKGFNVSAEKDLRGYLQKGFELKYTKTVDCLKCENTGGRCGVNPTLSGSYVCFCKSNVHRFNCSDGMIVDITTWGGGVDQGRRSSSPSKVLIAAVSASGVVFVALLATMVTLFIHHKRMKVDLNKKEAISNISPTRYSYSQLKKFTNKFSSKLGEGGYGSVYEGIIHRNGVKVPVAVKLLKSKQSQNQFMNEVATVGNVHHNHLVSLMGYCAQGDKRALVYEFMENGSLDKYIYTSRKGGGERNDASTIQPLSHKQMHAIALETGRGILYLHQGCRNRILHCDIKPHNVLLDSDFTAKVADFGLARMIDKDHSHVSLTRARGTPGFVAPEMWLKNYGPVTEKSDVYSYGMLLLEMVGGRKNYDLEANDESINQVYFPIWAFNKVKNGESPLPMKREDNNASIVIDEEGGRNEREEDEEEEVVERICLVGLWCIQHIPSNRPYMDRVIQMLEGTVEVRIPPNPFPPEMDTNAENINYFPSVYFSVEDHNPSVYFSIDSGSKAIEHQI